MFNSSVIGQKNILISRNIVNPINFMPSKDYILNQFTWCSDHTGHPLAFWLVCCCAGQTL